MTTLAARADGLTPRYRRVPWSPAAWRQTLYLVGGIPVQLAALAVLLVPALAARKIIWVIPILFLAAAVFLALPLLTQIERYRLRATAGVDIPPRPGIADRWSGPGLVAMIRSRATWQQAGYHLVAAPFLAAAAVLTFLLWLAGVGYTLVYAWAWTRVDTNPLRHGMSAGVAHVPVLEWIPLDLALTAGGIVALAAAPRLSTAVGALDARLARALLGPSREEELQLRVEQLTQTRAGAVDAADAERRRLERDLHDGTQQRLVSLAINLGMARAEGTAGAQAELVIAEAHEEAKAALAELRNLIRGLHPPVLEDRGLDAALSGVAARMPIPVKVTVDVPRRPPATIEAVAYFVVSEGLTNISKHAQATQAEVFVHRAEDRLHIIVSDDGVGGADPARGTGLAGLAKRAASVDGSFEITSPAGGPTLLSVDLPCAR
ncbi:MAG: sensor domain-containing protein [Actinobacteria bacterium]|nr:sensor domain-containing protein [Actinomycetota bacterium]